MSPTRTDEMLAAVEVLIHVHPGVVDSGTEKLNWEPGDDLEIDVAIECVTLAAIRLFKETHGMGEEE